jgi:pSer/pThr/pTyr-binding forkhead associated (FHA) protein
MDALRLRVAFRDSTSTLTFRRLPVHLGRDDTNDCRLDFGFVSRRHATVGHEDGHLVLRDEGSLTGTWVRGGREQVGQRMDVDLGTYGNEFSIGALRFRAELVRGAEDGAEVDDLLENLGSEDFETPAEASDIVEPPRRTCTSRDRSPFPLRLRRPFWSA